MNLKLSYILQIVAILVGTVVLASVVQPTEESISQVRGLSAIALAIVGCRHMVALGRPWGWGLFAVTGIGALVILFLPRKAAANGGVR